MINWLAKAYYNQCIWSCTKKGVQSSKIIEWKSQQKCDITFGFWNTVSVICRLIFFVLWTDSQGSWKGILEYRSLSSYLKWYTRHITNRDVLSWNKSLAVVYVILSSYSWVHNLLNSDTLNRIVRKIHKSLHEHREL